VRLCGRFLAVLAALSLVAVPAGAAAASQVTTVRPGESIQAALDAAPPGGTVVVQPGEYRENLEIVKDGVTLLGRGAVLRPPDTPEHRRCSAAIGLPGNMFGVCVAGDLGPSSVPGGEPIVNEAVHNVTVRGLTVAGFPLTGIVVFGGQDTRIAGNELHGGTAYALLVSVSSGTAVTGNRVIGGDSAGIYIGTAPAADALVAGNTVTDAGLMGIYLRNTSHGTVTANNVQGACVGIGLVATAPRQDAVSDWRVTANHLQRNNRTCRAGATLTGTGVLLAGVSRITVSGNVIHHNEVAPGTAPWGGGIVLAGGRFGGPTDSIGVTITGNLLYENLPYDITVLDPGVDNRIERNVCQTSLPAALCPAQPVALTGHRDRIRSPGRPAGQDI
jgi:parallel beta-helix repeat protein